MSYIGHLLTCNGVKAGPEKIEAIMKMPKSIDVKGVQRYLGLVNYLTKFLGNISDICEPIQRLTQESTWEWTFEQDEAMESIKKAVCNAPILKIFNS